MIHSLAARSSSLQNIEHVPASGQLIITFKDGSRYHYSGVPDALVSGLMAAKSPGTFFHHNVKGKFQSKKLPSPQ
jgi:KTSC domain